VEGIGEKANVAVGSIDDVFRDGRVKPSDNSGRPFSRIIKVRFSAWSEKVKFMSSFNRVKPSGAKFYARPDLTHRQRMADNALREKVRALKSSNAELDIMIYKGNIVYRATKLPFNQAAQGGQADDR
jgi:hypothetical protein